MNKTGTSNATTTITTTCQREECGKTFECAPVRYKRAKSFGTRLFCSQECARLENRASSQPRASIYGRYLPPRP